MFLEITKDRATLVDGIASVFVKDEDYLLLSRDGKAREKFLQDLGVSSIIVDRLGNEISPDAVFEKVDYNPEVPDIKPGKEMGYHHRL